MKPTLLCIHGYMTSTSYWDGLEHVDSTRYALKGHDGNLQAPNSWDEEVDLLSEWLLAHPKPRHIIAHSLGGYLLIDSLIKNDINKEVDQVILLNSSFIKDDAERQIQRRRSLTYIKKRWEIFKRLVLADKSRFPDLYALQRKWISELDCNAIYQWQKLMIERLEYPLEYLPKKNNWTWIVGKYDQIYHIESMCSLLYATNTPYHLVSTEHHSLYQDNKAINSIVQNIIN